MFWDNADAAILALVTLPLLIYLGRANWRRTALLAALFALVLVADNVLVTLPLHVDAVLWFKNRTDWLDIAYSNWEGKTYAILMAVVALLALCPWLGRRQFALTLRQHPGSIRPALILGVILLLPIPLLALFSGKGPFDPELLLYLLLMPGLNEELVYRSLLLGLAHAIVPPRKKLLGAPIGWGVIIVSIIFGLLHGFSIAPGWQVHLDPMPILWSGGYGLAFAWMRQRTGSLLLPVIFHGLVDFFGFFLRML